MSLHFIVLTPRWGLTDFAFPWACILLSLHHSEFAPPWSCTSISLHLSVCTSISSFPECAFQWASILPSMQRCEFSPQRVCTSMSLHFAPSAYLQWALTELAFHVLCILLSLHHISMSLHRDEFTPDWGGTSLRWYLHAPIDLTSKKKPARSTSASSRESKSSRATLSQTVRLLGPRESKDLNQKKTVANIQLT